MSNPDRNVAHLYPAFGIKARSIERQLNEWLLANHPGWTCQIGETFRSTKRQQELYAQGRTKPGSIVTKIDGVTVESGHQTVLAFDMWFFHNGRIVWEGIPEDVWPWYGHLCRAEGCVWGGDWDSDQKSSDEKFVDGPHCEWPRKDKKTYALAKEWAHKQGLA